MKIILLIAFILCFKWTIKAQTATIHFDIKNAKGGKIELFNHDYSNANVLFKGRESNISLVDGHGVKSFELSKSIFLSIYYSEDSPEKSFNYNLFLSPGNDLNFSAGVNQPNFAFSVGGKGNENNQPLIQKTKDYIDGIYKTHKQDTLPDNVFAAILKQNDSNKTILKNYIKLYHPSKEFIKLYSLSNQYFPLWSYISFKGNHKYEIREAYTRNEDKWQHTEDSLTNIILVNNDEALNIPGYVYFLPIYLERIKEKLWDEAYENPKQFFKKWYETDSITKGRKLMDEDPENDLRARIIDKYFTGKTAEFLYAALFKEAMDSKQDNIPQIFERFKQKFPNSQYTSYMQPFAAQVMEKENRTLTNDMVLIQNSDSLKNFDDVLKLVKGKTVLLDMWGTWCGPCREELLHNSDAIKNHFKNKGLDYLYIANYDLVHPDKWKQLIPYYNLTGINILASQELTGDIMKKVKGTGFPTYIIIKKDGTYELSKAGYPMDTNKLYKQLEEAINESK